jgi:hypothetical protein
MRAHSLVLLAVCLCNSWKAYCDDQVLIDIHISVDEPVLSQVSAINQWAYSAISGTASFPLDFKRLHFAGEVIDFKSIHDAHVTLYLTAFPSSNIAALISAVSSVAAQFNFSCEVASGGINVTGIYAMLSTGTPACLQLMSDAVVNAT